MRTRLLLLCLFTFMGYHNVYGQLYPTQYRPPGISWYQLNTSHFRIVYPQGEDSAAYQTARILEHEYPEIQQLVGGSLDRFPVILNDYNDRSNGFVSPLHFRSEIYLSPLKGKSMNPQTGNWLETVVPHELVHALHFSHGGGIISNTINIFSPDFARSIHSAIPFGIHEGIATYHESENIVPGGGRANYPYFYNQFNAVFQEGNRWSIGQSLSLSSFSRPFNRHYIGGVEFTSWLQQQYGDQITRNAIDFYIRWPFLGYGVALKHETGLWPLQLYNRFEEDHQKALSEKERSRRIQPLEINYKGRDIRRPQWLNDSTLIFFGSFYNARPGFYTYQLKSGRLTRFLETLTVRDFYYRLSKDSKTLLYSNYIPDAKYDNAFKTELFAADLDGGQTTKLTSGTRTYAPFEIGDTLYALQNHAASSRLVRIINGDSTIVISDPGNTEFVEVAPAPDGSSPIAIIANRRGVQGLWLANDIENVTPRLRETPDIAFPGGSISDVSWHPDSRRLLFTSDHTGTMNIYEYSRSNQQLLQITDTPFNAMEASYSPSGDRIGVILQNANERLPAVVDRDDFFNAPVDPSIWKSNPATIRKLDRSLLGSRIKGTAEWESSPYRTGLSWLKPRTVLPIVEEVSNTDTYEIGIQLHSNDLLQKNSYELSLTGVQSRFWYDFSYHHTGFFPGLETSLFRRPSFPVLRLPFPNETTLNQRFLREEQGVSVSTPFNWTLKQNSRISTFSFIPELRYSGIRYFDYTGNNNPVSNTSGILIGNLFSVYHLNIQQNIRDLQPNTGLTFYGELEHYLHSEDIRISTLNNDFRLTFNQPTGLRGGIFGYISPLRKLNQSLRIGVEALTQSNFIFDNQDLVSNGFSNVALPGVNNMGSLSTRYTIPLFYPDNGGFLVPLYLSNIYLVLFSNTVTDLSAGTPNDLYDRSRTVIGGGIRARIRLSNLSLDLGIGFGYEPSRSDYNVFIGHF